MSDFWLSDLTRLSQDETKAKVVATISGVD